MGWSRTKSDKVGRVVELQMFGGTALPAPWNNNAITTGTVSTSYEANFATTTEETGLAPLRAHRTVTDGLGRVVRVDEYGRHLQPRNARPSHAAHRLFTMRSAIS